MNTAKHLLGFTYVHVIRTFRVHYRLDYSNTTLPLKYNEDEGLVIMQASLKPVKHSSHSAWSWPQCNPTLKIFITPKKCNAAASFPVSTASQPGECKRLVLRLFGLFVCTALCVRTYHMCITMQLKHIIF